MAKTVHHERQHHAMSPRPVKRGKKMQMIQRIIQQPDSTRGRSRCIQSRSVEPAVLLIWLALPYLRAG